MSTQLQNKFSDFQPQPPEGMWDKIADTLDGDTDYSFAERMFHYQAMLPKQTWDKIAIELDKDAGTDAPRVGKRYLPFLKYAAAVILIAGLILTGLLINDRSVSNEPTANTSSKKGVMPGVKNTPAAEQEAISDEMQQTSYGAQMANTKRRPSPAIPISSLQLDGASMSLNNMATIIRGDDKPLVRDEVVDRYILFSKTTGDAVKLSKKLFSLFACFDEDETCKKDIEAVQQKMASPTMMASADFTEVLEALQTINSQ